MEKDLKLHWNTTYEQARIEKLGWYEDVPEPSLRLINKCNLNKDALLLNVGVGASTLIDELLKQGYTNIIANDISSNALDTLKLRLKKNENKIKWIVDDLTQPLVLNNLGSVDLWHDRAVLHFFTGKAEQDTYFDLLKKLVKKEAYVVIATFNLESATKCSGLTVHRYDETMLKEKLGDNFILIEAFDYAYTMPSGDLRKYVYTLFKRLN